MPVDVLYNAKCTFGFFKAIGALVFGGTTFLLFGGDFGLPELRINLSRVSIGKSNASVIGIATSIDIPVFPKMLCTSVTSLKYGRVFIDATVKYDTG